MASRREPSKYHRGFVFGSFIFGLSFVICTLLINSTLVKIRGRGEIISVTGAAFKPITSDFAVWDGRISTAEPTPDEAYAQIERGLAIVEGFLNKEGFDKTMYNVGTITINKKTDCRRDIISYTLTQSVRMELNDVDRITRIAKRSSSLIEQGIKFVSHSPRYIFAGLDPLILEIIEAATENARLRVEKLAKSQGKKWAPHDRREWAFFK